MRIEHVPPSKRLDTRWRPAWGEYPSWSPGTAPHDHGADHTRVYTDEALNAQLLRRLDLSPEQVTGK